jgi:phage terminase large subunit-like protein
VDFSTLDFGALNREMLEQAQYNLKFNWELHARPKQLPPPGDYRFLLILAGRGFGKTRTGAEYVRMLAKGGKHPRIAIIGPTAGDVRDIMIEGDSGILACSPNTFFPNYEPSKRQITWPNGVIGKLYSADEPERLRGQNSHAGWCIVGHTLILMADGAEKPIKDVLVGELVATRSGPKAVTESRLTNHLAEVFKLSLMDGRDIIGTANHPIWIEGRGFIPLESVQRGMLTCVTHACGSRVSGSTKKASKVTTSLPSVFTGWSGNQPTESFLRGMTSTIRTKIQATINSTIWSCLRSRHIANFTPKISWVQFASRLTRERAGAALDYVQSARPVFWSASFAGLSFPVPSKMQASFALSGAWRRPGAEPSPVNSEHANDAGNPMRRRRDLSGTAQNDAILSHPQTERELSLSGLSLAPSAERNSPASGPTRDSASMNAPLSFTQEVSSVQKYPKLCDVYNLTVEGSHEYFANGILTHNCDELAAWEYPEAFTQFKLGFRLGQDLRCIITTTPRPCPVIVELMKRSKDPAAKIVIVRGSTYENKANLAPEFFTEVIKQYEGTRLGRQELQGELLEDTPGALWNTVMLDRTRVKPDEMPEMVRIVVSIDPSVTSTEESDECGMVVCGKGMDGDLYILEDLSGSMSTLEWAKKAIEAYHRWHADAMIAETNNGGDLVENILRAVDASIPFRKVTASRGKHLRAEPVAALWEKGEAHLVGNYPKMEEQCCAMDAEGYTGTGSPDRLDAMVHGGTELMLGTGTVQMFPDFRARSRNLPTDNACHVTTPPELKEWWPRWISIHAGGASAAHWWCREPSKNGQVGRIHVYREYIAIDVTPEEFGMAVANQSKAESSSSRIIPVWMSEKAFDRTGGKAVAFSIADGINRSVGENKAFLFVHNDSERSIPDQGKRIRAIQSRMGAMPNGSLSVQALRGGKDQSGWDIVRELLRWRPNGHELKPEAPDWDYARSLATDMNRYYEYMQQFQEAPKEVLPILVISSACPGLVQAMSSAVRSEKDESALAHSGAGFVLQSLRIGALASREDIAVEPMESFVGKRLERLGDDATGFAKILVAQKAEGDWHGMYDQEPVSIPRVWRPGR